MKNKDIIEPQVTKVNKDSSSEFKKNKEGNKEIQFKSQNISNDINNINLSNRINNNSDVAPDIPAYRRNLIFSIFLLSDLFLNYDTGVIPASLIEITNEIDLDYSEQALIASLLYLGLSCSSFFVGFFFSKFSPSKVCSASLFINAISSLIFSFSSKNVFLFSTRFMMGVTEAFLTVYGPVWVNNYSPLQYMATWMGILHSCSIVGVFIGYLFASIINNFLKDYLSWRFAMQIQGYAEIIFALFFFMEKDEYINVDLRKTIPAKEFELEQNDYIVNNSLPSNNASRRNLHSGRRHDPRVDTVELDNLGRYLLQAKIVLKNKLYVTLTLGMSSIYFIVTGIQFWITKYLIEILNADQLVVNITFSLISITAPLSGVLFGGTVSDKYGGYKGRNESKALQMCVGFAIVAFIFSFPMGFLFQIFYLSVLLWTFLFFGASIIPIATGIMISTVPKDCQATSSSISQLIFNLFGYFCSPMITGFIMDSFEDKNQGFIWGMRVIFWWAIICLICFITSYFISKNNNRRNSGENENSSMIEDSMKDNLSKFMRLEINRRLAQGSSFM